MAPALLTSGMFAFLASMDNYPVRILFTDAWTKTLPIQMPQYVEELQDPTIAAISTGLILLAIVALIIGDRLVGLRRLADFKLAAHPGSEMNMPVTLPPTTRDFRGYGSKPPEVKWPGGARLAVSVVVNIEEGAELSLGMGDERNEPIYEVVDNIERVPDLCMESHFGYGTRAGWPRIRAALAKHKVRATMNCCARAIAYSPWLATEAVADGHEISSHGWRWERQAHMSEAHERGIIAKAVAVL
ncbi:MAG: chitin deacetylase, partial [Pseudomonadota bacterium]